jgi:hypothetical protein
MRSASSLATSFARVVMSAIVLFGEEEAEKLEGEKVEVDNL